VVVQKNVCRRKQPMEWEPRNRLPQNRRWRKRLPRRQPGRRLRHRYQKRNLPGRFQGPLPVLEVRIHEQYFQDDILATADVRIGDICTIRNVKVREGDYGPEVVMPRTKLPETGRFKDACYFDSLEAKTQFDAAVMKAYQQVMEPITNAPDHESRYEDMDEEDMDYDEMGEIHGGMGGMNF
jgi:DNA-binding cell septation regulator SpoVG